MMHTLLYSEMNQAVVPGGPTSVNPGHETGGYGECQVPSPSQWSDPCYSPPSFHSPQHLPVELEKVKEEPFSPPSSNGGSPTYIPSAPSAILTSGALHHGVSPYGRPSTGGSHVIKKDAYESCINLSDLLSENQNLIQQHNSPPPASASPPYGATYPDHPLLRGRLEDASGVFQLKKISPSPTNAGGSPSPLPLEPSPTSTALHLLQPSHHALEDPQGFYAKISASPASSTASSSCDEGLNFLESLVDVKRELEDDVGVGSSCGSPAAPSPGGAGGQQRDVGASQQVSCQRDILETVEILAQEHNMRDVQRVSDSLNIPLDPAQWSVEDVRSWLKLQASQLNLPPLMLDFWNYGGPSLLKLTEQQFRQLAPIGGELLYAKLEIWREALKSSPKLSSSSPDPRIPYIFLQHQAHHLQSPHHQGGLLGHQEPAAQMLLTHHNLHLHQLQQQHQQQQLGLPSGGSSPSGSSMPGSAPSSPPLPMSSSLAQVPTPVAQVSQQSSVSPAPSSPQQGGGTAAASAVYLDEPCLDMAALLQQQQQQQPPAVSPTGSPHGAHNTPPPHCPQEDAYDSEDEVEEETCSNTGGGGGGGSTGRGGTHIHLWQFLKELLQQPQLYGSCIRWLDRQKGVFKIEDSVRVARLWGKRKNRPAMNYDKLSRSIRQYYKKGIMKKTERSQRLVYQFCHPYSL